jgi:two-component system, OmpR family, sensor kinase
MRFWPQSVRWRLTLWYATTIAAILVVFGASSLYALRRIMASRTDHFLEQARDAFTTELTVHVNEEPVFTAAALAAMADIRFRDIEFLVFDSTAKLLAESHDPAVFEPGSPSEPPLDRPALARSLVTGNAASFINLTLPDEKGGYRVSFKSVKLAGKPYYVVAAQARHGMRETLERVTLAYLLAIPLFSGISALGGYVLARRALDPVATMSKRAHAITASNLHERLPVKNADDELGGLAVMINDLLGRLEYSFEQQRRFVADASHELRTPVAIVRSESEIALERESRTEAEYRDALTVVRDAGQRLGSLVDDLFLLARADSGNRPVRRESLYLDDLITDVVRSVRTLAARRSVRVEIGPLREAPFAGDPELLSRMLLNLLDNAAKYSPADSRVNVRLENGDGTYRIHVTDQGTGVPPEAQSRIFERFYRVDRARSRDEVSSTSGAGLGLAIAKWVAEAHDGALDLVRSNESGSEFRITLPLRADASTID